MSFSSTSSSSPSSTRIRITLKKKPDEAAASSKKSGAGEPLAIATATATATATAKISPTPHKHLAPKNAAANKENHNFERIASTRTNPSTAKNRPRKDSPFVSSAVSLPPLSPTTARMLRDGRLEFPINDECTSLKLAPSCRHLVAGFTDGTLRLFDLTGTWGYFGTSAGSNPLDDEQNQQDDLVSFGDEDSDDDEQEFDGDHPNIHSPSTVATKDSSDTHESSSSSLSSVVCSKSHQRYGAVCCQIRARGVHTSLQMHVDVSQDGLYAFGGVTRGSTEIVAVHLGQLETQPAQHNKNVLDLVQVQRHSDAKLKGFGACIRLECSPSDNDKPKYLLLTGKGIKNIHIWCFAPYAKEQWQCLYDTPTNGNTITLLHLRYDPNGCLQAMSKSDDQKLRLWDLSYEQQADNSDGKKSRSSVIAQFRKAPVATCRPKRPPYVDVASTESTVGIAGAFAFGGGDGMYNQMSVVSLDVDNVRSPFNHTELALPGNTQGRRQQRGDLKSIVRVAGMVMDAGHVLLELSDGSVVQYLQHGQNSVSFPRLQILPADAFGPVRFPLDDPLTSRTLCVTRVAASGVVVAGMAIHRSGRRGSIVLRELEQDAAPRRNGYWGFQGVVAVDSSKISKLGSPTIADKKALAACVQPTPCQAVQSKQGENKSRPDVQLFAESLATPSVASQAAKDKPSLTACVSLSPEKEAVQQAAVSPEEAVPPSEGKRREKDVANKKNGAMMKYLRQAGGAAKTTKTSTKRKKEARPKRKEPETADASVTADMAKEPDPKKGKLSRPPLPGNTGAEEKGLSCWTKKSAPATNTEHSQSPMRLTRAMRKEADIEKAKEPYISVHYGRELPSLLTEHVAKSTVYDRIGLSFEHDQPSLLAQQEADRMKLAAEHRAGHELIWKKVLSGTDRVIKSLTQVPSISDAEARKQLARLVKEYQIALDDLLSRQRMEASALAAEHALALQGHQAPELQVSFPFDDVFGFATRKLEQFLRSWDD